MQVTAIDIVTLFEKEDIQEEDFVVVKMDIEGEGSLPITALRLPFRPSAKS